VKAGAIELLKVSGQRRLGLQADTIRWRKCDAHVADGY
jgi:hypothetical protein